MAKMTQKEYLALIKESPVFKTLDEELKESVLNATGELMESYAEIFLDAAKIIQEAQKELVTKTENAIKKYKEEIARIGKQHLKVAEERSVKEDMEKQDALLNQLDNI